MDNANHVTTLDTVYNVCTVEMAECCNPQERESNTRVFEYKKGSFMLPHDFDSIFFRFQGQLDVQNTNSCPIPRPDDETKLVRMQSGVK